MNITNRKTYNNQDFIVNLFLYDSNISLTSPASIETIDDEAYIIPSEEITYIMIENSIVDIIPTAQFEIIDNGFLLTYKLKKENLRFKLTIKKVSSDYQIDTIWIIKKFDILNFATSSIQYKIWAELDCAIPLYTTCYYATSNDLYNDKDGGENPYKIIKDILRNVGFKMYSDISINEDGYEMSNRYSPPSVSNKIHFITNHNMYAIDAVKFLLAKAVSTLDVSPPAYLIYNIKDNKGFVTTRENLFKESSIDAQPDSTKVFYSMSEGNFGKQYQMKDIRTDPLMDENEVGRNRKFKTIL